MGLIQTLEFTLLLAHLRVELIAQDREEPRPQRRSGLEAVRLAPRSQDRFLNEIVGPVRIMDERARG